MSAEKVVLLYSGGLDTSVILKWLSEKGYEVHAYVADVGQREDWGSLETKAMSSGATSFRIGDLKNEFAGDYVFPAALFGSRYEGRYLLGTSLARPIIIKDMVNFMRETGSKIFAHGATGKGNDQVRFELSAAMLMPEIEVITPWRMDEFRKEFPGRQEMIEYAEAQNIPIKVSKAKPWSSDENLLHISFEAGVLEDPNYEPDEDMFELSVSPEKAPDQVTYLEVGFEAGVPVSLDGKKLNPLDLLTGLNKVGGENGIGRIDIVESRFVGMKSRGVYETPGGAILYEACRDLVTLVLDKGVIQLIDTLAPRFAKLVYDGFWFAEECQLLLGLLKEANKKLTGSVKLKLYKGSIIAVGRSSEYSLYDEDIASMEADSGTYNQNDATGFIRLNALPLRMAAKRHA